ncbi:F-box/RNI-like superfamily protein [Rhynchospora pubera]|uniref:F-box/RNI-like superfamily protein n=1 Tax=Rhynchospora pubera TaxID=906938 RepID=A0AAV8GQ43_9POAL|nr:F-box/RNI-like superfamily protein [Rhynchospora pubera]
MEDIIDEKKTESENSDRISDLPDCLLIDILSLLNPRDAVRTCILSKRWHHLWSFIQSLSFKFDEFSGEAERFNNFVSSFLQLRDEASSVHKFKLSYSVTFDAKLSDLVLRTWIQYALDHKVKNLSVELLGRPSQFLLKCQFHCDTLENMYLNGFHVIHADNVCLPKLRELSLVNVTVHSNFMQKLLSGCPALVTLSMHKSEICMNNIKFGTIKSLTMVYCTFKSLGLPTLSISAPCVQDLKFIEKKGYKVTFNNMSRLNKAIIVRPDKLGFGRTDDNFVLPTGISGVRFFGLMSIYLKELLNRELRKCRIFNNLTHLGLGFCSKRCNFTTLSSFLKVCPNLKTLSFHHTKYFCEEDQHQEKNSEITQQYQGFPCQHLKLVHIDCYGPHERNCAHQMQNLVLQWTKHIVGIKIIFCSCKA